MKSKSGISKIAIIIIVFLIILLIAGATVAVIWFLQRDTISPSDIKLYDDYAEGEGFVDEDYIGEVMTPLATGLVEYRNDELGIRFGYLEGMEVPVDEEADDGTYISTITDENKSTIIQLRVGKIDESQPDLDHVKSQKDALTQELIVAETKEVEVEENGKKVMKTIVPEKVSDIESSYTIYANQLAVKFKYTENDLKATRVLTIKDGKIYSLTYKANEEDYSDTEEANVFNSFEFISKIDEIEKSDLNTVTINDKEYTLPVKVNNIDVLTIDSKYVSQRIQPNYFTIVSLYELQEPKYSAYVYNAKACVEEIGTGYITAVSTDINRGGNIKIYKGIEIGTPYTKVKELLGTPSKQYTSDEGMVLTNIYQIENVTIQLKFQNEDSKVDENSRVVSILLKVSK